MGPFTSSSVSGSISSEDVLDELKLQERVLAKPDLYLDEMAYTAAVGARSLWLILTQSNHLYDDLARESQHVIGGFIAPCLGRSRRIMGASAVEEWCVIIRS